MIPAPDIGRKRILVVDDNSEIRKLLVLYIEQSGYDTVEAATGHQALEQARATTPNLIFMDLAMPDGTGDEAIVSLKADPLTRDIPVVVLTAFLGGALVNRAIAAGAAEIVRKPVDIKWLGLVIQRHLSVHQKTHHIVH